MAHHHEGMTLTENHVAYAILLGADMEPERIRARPDLAGARFAGIGAVAARAMAGLLLPLPQVDEVWGVVVRLPEDTHLDGPVVPVALRTGEEVEATVLTSPADLDAVDAVLAEAYYWELPVAYRDALGR
jgi:hypothetical protein